MTNKLYYENSYLKNFTATVLDSQKTKDGFLITLNQTAFYPEGGGQPSDIGYFLVKDEKIDVNYVFEKDDIIYHTTQKEIPINTEIEGFIDFDVRFDNMQQHTGEHILCGIVVEGYGYDNVGFHIGKEEVLVDFNGTLTKDDIDNIQMLANKEVFSNNQVLAFCPDDLSKVYYRSKKELTGKVRIVKAGKADICACCGTHTNTTGEVGAVIITGFISYKGGTRITMLSGKRAIDYYTKVNDTLFEINKLLSKNNDTVLSGVQSLIDNNKQLNYELTQTKLKLFDIISQNITSSNNVILYSYDNLTSSEMQSFAKLLTQKANISLLISLQENNSYKFIINSKNISAKEIGNSITEHFSGKGGGSKESFQGFIQNFNKEKIQKILNSYIG